MLGESRRREIVDLLEAAENVISSELLLLECDRALIREEAAARMTAAESAEARVGLARATRYWTLLRVGGEILDRARQPFPREPVRSLDALHLASLIVGASMFADLELLSFDDRIRENAAALGFALAAA